MPLNRATSEGTANYRRRFNESAAPGHFREANGLTLSSIGIGTYLGQPDDDTDQKYADAVVRAVELGCNVIDSAANYRFQRSERSIGRALDRLTASADFKRDEIVLCTKGGFLPFDGTPPRDISQYVNDNFVKPGIATFDDLVGGSHCMTPRYLQNQLDQSLRNLGVETIDVYYIHNPESQLSSVSEDEFYFRMRKAFECLEESALEGKLGAYGVATWNGFRVNQGTRGYHSLESMNTIAKEIAGDSHHFRYIQLHFNLAMTEALSLKNQTIEDEHASTLEAAAHFGINSIASASVYQGRIANKISLEMKQALGNLSSDTLAALQFSRSSPSLTTALVGMSSVRHVEENLQLMGVPPISEEVYRGLFLQHD